jgi:hypothetical protein
MAETKILRCSCNSEFQDAKYGKDMRLHNVLTGKKDKQARCTVCSNVK